MLLEKDGVVDPSSLWKRARFGEDSIIANLDTGNSYNSLPFSYFFASPFLLLIPLHI